MVKKQRDIQNDIEKAIKNRDRVPPNFEDAEQHGVSIHTYSFQFLIYADAKYSLIESNQSFSAWQGMASGLVRGEGERVASSGER